MSDGTDTNTGLPSSPTAFEGLLQFSSALSPPRYLDESHLKRERRFAANRRFLLSNNDVEQFREQLSRRVEHVPGFSLERCYDQSRWKEEGAEHTWLGRESRHAAIDFGGIFRQPIGSDFPSSLRWSSLQSVQAPFRTYLRVQRSTGVKSGPGRLSDGFDCNDYLLCEQNRPADDLAILQKFFAILYAQRRSRLFASDLSERIYNIWLPPGLIRNRNESTSSFALLPFVTMVRRPFRPSFRQTVTLSVILVPVGLEGSAPMTPRRMTRHEIFDTVHTMDGGSSHANEAATRSFELLGSPLQRYVEGLQKSDHLKIASALATRAVDKSKGSPVLRGTLRQWMELLFAAIEEPVLPRQLQCRLPDAILKAIRLCSIWSIMVVTPELQPFSTANGQVIDGVWWPGRRNRHPEAGLPSSIAELVHHVANGGADGLPVPPDARLDDVDSGNRDSLMWGFEGARCVLTVNSAAAERFPDTSSLYLFGWTSHMIIGVASVRAMMGSLAAEAEYSNDGAVRELAEQSHRITLEMEEMFDLSISWPEYERLYHRMRKQLGIEATYRHVQERVEQLSRQAEVVARTQQERSLTALQIGGGLLALALLSVGIIQILLVNPHGHYGMVAVIGGAAVAVVVVLIAIREAFRRS
jgi:hypothetical protein